MPVPIQELQNIIKNNDIARNEMFDFEDKIEDHAQQNREFFLIKKHKYLKKLRLVVRVVFIL